MPVYIHTNQQIKCRVAITNYDVSIIDYITKDIWKENAKGKDGIYVGLHTDYTSKYAGTLPKDKRVKYYIAITKDILDNFKTLSSDTNVMLCRNPLTIEDEEKPLIICSPTRLTDGKGGDIMYKLANTLEIIGIPFLWFIITTDEYKYQPIFTNHNVIHIPNRLDVDKFLSIADWVVLPSKCEGDSYTIREALYRNIPIVARHLKYFDEYNIKDGVNALFINDDNIYEVAKKMQKKLIFNFKRIEDGYNKILIKSKNKYMGENNMKVKVLAKFNYFDNELGKYVEKDKDTWITTKFRAETLMNNPAGKLVEIIEEIKEEKKENKKISTKNTKKAVK